MYLCFNAYFIIMCYNAFDPENTLVASAKRGITNIYLLIKIFRQNNLPFSLSKKYRNTYILTSDCN